MKKTIVKTAYSKSRAVKKNLKSKKRTSPSKARLKKQ